MAYASNATFTGLQLGNRIASLRADMADKIARGRIYRQTRNELDALSNRELTDLGISRSMIKRIALEAAYAV